VGGWGLLRSGGRQARSEAGTAGISETYQCEDGRTVALVGMGGNRVQLRWGDQQQVLTRVRAGSGERYTNDDYALHTEGSEALLFRGLQRVGRCHLAR
jgi:membrane-bound inhibitor of C-type lysozyme